MNKGSIVERLCSDLDRKEPRYKLPTLLLLSRECWGSEAKITQFQSDSP